VADRFWVGGTGNWSDATNHWATVSGGAPGAGNTPTAADRAIFDAASNTTAYTVTVDVAAVCLDLLFNAAPSVSGTITWAGTFGMTISGSMTLLAGMTRSITGTLTFNSTTTGRTISTNGVVLGNNLTFNGVGGGWLIVGALANSSASIIDLLAGALDTNGQTISCGVIQTSGSLTRSLTLGASNVTLAGGGNVWRMTSTTGLTLSAASSTINISVAGIFTGGGLTYGTVNYSLFSVNNTFADGSTFGALNLIGRANKTDPALTLAGNQTVTGTFTAAGNSVVNRLVVASSTAGTPRTITAAAVAISNVDFQDIAGAGAATWSGASIGDRLGNSGITMTPAVTQTATGTASFTWSTHGWTTRVPLPQDDVIIPNAFVAGRVITADMPSLGRNITFTCTGNPTFTPTSAVGIFGSIEFAPGMATSTGFGLALQARSSVTMKTNGVALTLSISTQSAAVTLLDALTTSSSLVFRGGTFNDGGFNVTALLFDMQVTLTKSLIKSGAWTITGPGSAWIVNASGTTIADTGTTKFTDASAATKTFAGAGFTYNNVWFSGGGTGVFQVTGANTFNQFKVDSGLSVQFTAATTTTAADWQLSGATIGSITAAQHTLAKSGAGKVQVNGAAISQSNATPANTFYAANSTNGGSNSGWVFGAYLALDTMAPALAAGAWSVRKNWRLALGTLPVVAAFADWQPRDVRPDPDYVIAASPRTRSISR
jgi:hypothetical protein